MTQDYARPRIVRLFPEWQRDHASETEKRDHLSFWFWLRQEHPHLCNFRCQGYPDRKMRHWLLRDLGSVVDV
jgi:hypothetical protein